MEKQALNIIYLRAKTYETVKFHQLLKQAIKLLLYCLTKQTLLNLNVDRHLERRLRKLDYLQNKSLKNEICFHFIFKR